MILSMMIPSLVWASKKPKDKQKYQMLEGFSPESGNDASGVGFTVGSLELGDSDGDFDGSLVGECWCKCVLWTNSNACSVITCAV